MEITLEQVERLRQKADVSYAQAKQALEYSQGNLLDALIYLEERGCIPRSGENYYSTQTAAAPVQAVETIVVQEDPREKTKKKRGSFFSALRRALVDNELEVWRRQEPVTSVPVLIMLILLIFAFWVTIPLLILGLFLGFRYRFSGPDLERDDLNGVMERVATTADQVSRQVMDELHTQHEKYTKDRENK